MSTTGNAIALKLELKRLMLRHDLKPAPFTPIAPLPSTDEEISIEGLASPITIDRQFMKFGPYCWMPFRKDVPLLFRHRADRPAGRILDLRATDEGLFVRASVSDSDARRCPYFSVAATIHHYMLRDVDDPQRAHGLISCASVDEISLVFDPGNADAIVRPTPAPIQFYDLARTGIGKMIETIALLQRIDREPPKARAQPALQRTHKPHARPKPPSASREPHRRGSFGALVAQLERNHPI